MFRSAEPVSKIEYGTLGATSMPAKFLEGEYEMGELNFKLLRTIFSVLFIELCRYIQCFDGLGWLLRLSTINTTLSTF